MPPNNKNNDIDQRLSRLEATVESLAYTVQNYIQNNKTDAKTIISVISVIIAIVCSVGYIGVGIPQTQMREVLAKHRDNWNAFYEWKGYLRKTSEDVEEDIREISHRVTTHQDGHPQAVISRIDGIEDLLHRLSDDLRLIQQDRFTAKEGNRLEERMDIFDSEQRRRTDKVYK